MTRSTHERRGLTRLAVLCLPVAATLILPAAAFAATGTSTVIATVNGDGSVKAVKVVAANGTTGNFNGSLPVKVSISRSVSGGTSTYTYHVENTFSKQQDVTYTDTAGKQHSVSTEVQLPLVARLGVQVPKTFKNVTAPNGVVQTDPDGVNRVLFSLVLFSPIGSPTQDVTFSATGTGVPTSELSATTVNPSTTSGLASSSADATASQQQDDFWTGFATGGNGGLTQLADGVGKMVTGLAALAPGAHQLADGLKAAGDGATKLAVGTTAAHKGSQALTTGIGQIHGGQSQLTGGLSLINGGLGTLDGKDKGNPGLQGAVDGVSAIEGGVQQVLAGLQGIGGSVTTPTTTKDAQGNTVPSVLMALPLVKGGVDLVRTPLFDDLLTLKGLTTPGSPTFNLNFAGQLSPVLSDGVTPNPAFNPSLAAWVQKLATDLGTAGLPAGVDPAHPAGGALAQASAGLSGLIAGVGTITTGLNSHTPGTFGPKDPGGIDFGLLSLLDPTKGLPAAVDGVNKLFVGSTSALSGSQQLTTGSAKALAGSQQLTAGLALLASGQDQVAAGLPAAVTGAAQIADGADQLSAGAVAVHSGILAVQTGAVGPLLQQLQTGSQNAAKQVAILEATGAMASQAPGGAGSTYVLTQSPQGFKLAAAVSVPTSSSSSSDTGRNIGIGVGGLAALVIAVVAGFALGRRSGVSA